MKRTFAIGLSLILPSMMLGCGDDTAGQSGGSSNPGYGSDSGGDSGYDAPNNPDSQGQPDAQADVKAADALCSEGDCDDNNPCTEDSCDPSYGCRYDPAPMEGESCGTSNACVTNTCSNGSCVTGEKGCDDDNPCTADSCDPDTGCVNDGAEFEGEPCNDGDACTSGDVCTSGTCGGEAKDCNDDNPCTEDACDSVLGCVNDPGPLEGETCDDGTVCTEEDTCTNGKCKGTVLPCDDTNPCTLDVCDPVSGCSHDADAANGDSCSDGDLCTTNDVCSDGSCAGTAATCDDGNPCTADSCDSATGCVNDPAALNDTPCDDKNVCTTTDVCSNGACVGNSIDCSDENPCTVDSCDAVLGCQNLTGPADGASCSDNNVCTLNDTCGGGECIGGIPLSCSDGNQCTQDTCDPIDGCQHSSAPLENSSCNDNSVCTEGDTCTGGKCTGTPITCDDDVFCTADSCDPVAGCVYDPLPQNGVPCDDEQICTVEDACNGGICEGAPRDCNDDNSCTADSCDAETGDPDTGCLHETAPLDGSGCNDSDPCTIDDICSSGTCTGTLGPDDEENDGDNGDGVPDVCDNCPPTPDERYDNEFNEDQANSDGVRAWRDYSFTGEDLSDPQPVAFGDDPFFQLPMPFAFSMFGTTYEAGEPLYIHKRALFTFGTSNQCTGTESLVMPCTSDLFGAENMIALYWSQDVYAENTTVSYQLFGSPGSQYLVIEYSIPDNNYNPTLLQAVLYEGTNEIVLYIGSLSTMYYDLFTRAVAHTDTDGEGPDVALGAWYVGEWTGYPPESGLVGTAIRYTTSPEKNDTGDACSFRWEITPNQCTDYCGEGGGGDGGDVTPFGDGGDIAVFDGGVQPEP